jgi:hypothetical protein
MFFSAKELLHVAQHCYARRAALTLLTFRPPLGTPCRASAVGGKFWTLARHLGKRHSKSRVLVAAAAGLWGTASGLAARWLTAGRFAARATAATGQTAAHPLEATAVTLAARLAARITARSGLAARRLTSRWLAAGLLAARRLAARRFTARVATATGAAEHAVEQVERLSVRSLRQHEGHCQRDGRQNKTSLHGEGSFFQTDNLPQRRTLPLLRSAIVGPHR